MINKEMIEELKEQIRNKAKYRKSQVKKKYFDRFIRMIENDEVPKIRGRIVEETANDYFGRSHLNGVKIEINRNGKIIEKIVRHDANVSYEHWFPHTHWIEKTDEGLKTQLQRLVEEGTLSENDVMVIKFYDNWIKKTNNNLYVLEVPIKDVLPFLI